MEEFPLVALLVVRLASNNGEQLRRAEPGSTRLLTLISSLQSLKLQRYKEIS
jgi:hypothetical protein